MHDVIRQASGRRLNRVATLPYSPAARRRPVIWVDISTPGSRKWSPFCVKVDTGSQLTWFNWSVADALGVDPDRAGGRPFTQSLSNGQPVNGTMAPMDMKIAGVELALPRVFVVFSKELRLMPYQGLLGRNPTLAQFVFLFHKEGLDIFKA